MYAPTEKLNENKIQSAANSVTQKKNSTYSSSKLADNRPEAVAQKKMQEVLNNSQQISQPIQRVENVIQLKLRDEDAKLIWDFLTTNFTGEDGGFALTDSEIRRIYHTVTESATNRHLGLQMAMRAVKNIFKEKKPKSGAGAGAAASSSTESEEHGYYTSNYDSISIEQHSKLDDLISKYNITLSGDDISRGAESEETAKIGMAFGALCMYIKQQDLEEKLDNITCPGNRKNTKPYAGRTFMQIIGLAKSGIDCHNAYADALLECIDHMEKF